VKREEGVFEMFRDPIQNRVSLLRRPARSLALFGFFVASILAPVGARADGPKLLMLPFIVHSAEAPEYVSDGLTDMLSSRFERIGGIDLINAKKTEKGTSNLAVALDAARAVGADYVLFGSFTRFGKGASLDVQCAPVSAGAGQKPLREIFVHSGSIGEIIPDLDELAGKVTRYARGEAVIAPPSAGSAPSVPSRELRDLLDRVGALEDLIAQLLEAADVTEIVIDDEFEEGELEEVEEF